MSLGRAIDFMKQLGTFGNTQFDIDVTYGPVSMGDGTSITISDTLYGCLINKIEDKFGKRIFSINIQNIKRN